jgi:hypothetical protein
MRREAFTRRLKALVLYLSAAQINRKYIYY